MSHNSSQVHNFNRSNIRTYIGKLPDYAILGMMHIGRPWFLSHTTIEEYPESDDYRDDNVRGEIVFHLDVDRKRWFKCPCCGRMCKPHEYENRKYNNIKMLGFRTIIKAKVPKLKCSHCGKYPQIEVPWARPNVSYTIELEKEVLRNLGDRAITNVAESLGIGYWIIADIVQYRVGISLNQLDLSNVSKIYVDETSFRKGHRYVTVICDQDKRIIFMCEGKDSGTIDKFREWLVEHKGNPNKIEAVSCDMGLAYPAGVRRNFRNARICYDKFHVIKLISDAFDKCRKRMVREDVITDNCKFLTFKHENSFTDRQKILMERIQTDCKELAELYRIKETFSRMYNYSDRKIAEAYLKIWHDFVVKSISNEMSTAAESIWEKKDEILMWYEVKMNNGFAEAMNSLIQTTKRVARGYRNVGNFINMCFLKNGHLNIVF